MPGGPHPCCSAGLPRWGPGWSATAQAHARATQRHIQYDPALRCTADVIPPAGSGLARVWSASRHCRGMTTTHAAPAGALSALAIASGFLPWIAFTLVAQRLAADGVAWSALLAVAMTALAVIWDRARHLPLQLNLYSGVLFTAMAVTGFVSGHQVDRWLYEWGRPLVGVVLGLLILATSTVRPFTAGYAKRSTPQEYWTSPTFVKINRVLSATWGAAITLIGASAVAVTALEALPVGTESPHLLDLALNWVVPILVLVWTVHFTNAYPERATGSPH